jgi:hypothetical protein
LNVQADHGVRDIFVAGTAVVAAQIAGQVVLSFTGRSVPIVLAVMALVLCAGLSAAALTLGAARRRESRSG